MTPPPATPLTTPPPPSDHWDYRLLDLARYLAGWSKDPSTQVGSVIVDSARRILATGFNGLPIGVEDTLERLENRELKYEMIVHAERNAIISARRDLSGSTLYVWPMMPCSVCAAMIIQAGIRRVVAPLSENPRWVASFDLSKQMFEESGMELRLLPPSDEDGPDRQKNPTNL